MKAFPTHLFLMLLNAVSKLSWGALYKLSDIVRFLIFDIGQYRKKSGAAKHAQQLSGVQRNQNP